MRDEAIAHIIQQIMDEPHIEPEPISKELWREMVSTPRHKVGEVNDRPIALSKMYSGRPGMRETISPAIEEWISINQINWSESE